MPIITIPIHPFSYKIIMRDYADENGLVSAISYRSILYEQLNHKWDSYDQKDRLVNNSFTKKIDIKVSRRLYNRLDKHTYQAATYIFNMHRDRMLFFLLGHIQGEGNASSGLSLFYSIYNITDDDYDRETAYKAWTRFYAEWRKKTSWDLRKSLSRNAGAYKKDKEILPPTDKDRLDEVLSHFVAENFEAFIINNKFSQLLCSQAQAYIYYEIGKVHVRNIAKQQEHPEITVYKRIEAFRDRISYDEEMSDSLTTIIREKLSLLPYES